MTCKEPKAEGAESSSISFTGVVGLSLPRLFINHYCRQQYKLACTHTENTLIIVIILTIKISPEKEIRSESREWRWEDGEEGKRPGTSKRKQYPRHYRKECLGSSRYTHL